MLNKSTSEDIVISNALPALKIFKNSLHKPLRLAEIEKRMGLSHQTVFRKVKILESNSVLIRVGNYYKPNFENTLVFKILELISVKEKEKLFAKYPHFKKPFTQLINFATKNPYVNYVIMFGSYATGKATKTSDIDIFIVAEKSKFKEVKERLENLFNQLEGSYFFHKYGFAPIYAMPEDVKEMVDERKKFIQSIIEEGIIIYGEDNYYRNMASLLKEWIIWK